MFKTLKTAWGIPEIRKKILFTLFIIVIFRLGSVLTVPFIDTTVLATWMQEKASNGNFLEYLNILSGGALAKATMFSLGVTPYINASIIIQLLTYALPPLERLQRRKARTAERSSTRLLRSLRSAFPLSWQSLTT